MDLKSINQRLKTIRKLKHQLQQNINSDLEYIKSKDHSFNVKHSKVETSNSSTDNKEQKIKYLKYRDQHADVNFISKVRRLLDQIPDSNGSRYYNTYKVNIGIVADEFLFNSFKGVANFYYITKDNYKDYTNKLDMFLLVTSWKGLNMEWKGLGNPNIRKHRNQMFEILNHYKSNGIKTVFYSKEDPVNYSIFIELAQKCDFIFTTAEEMVEQYKVDCNNNNVDVLNFGVNPTYHNPVGFKTVNKLKGVLFSGSWYVKYPHRIVDTKRIFDGILDNQTNLKIVDRNYELKLERHFFPEKYVKYVSPGVDHHTLQKLHKLYDWAINLNSVKYSNTMFANRIYELQALGNILLSNYSVGVNNKFPNVFLINNRSEAKDILNGFTEEEKYNHQIFGIRSVMSNETTYHRIGELLMKTNSLYEKQRRSVAVVVKHDTKLIREMFNRQTYKDKELIIESGFDETMKHKFDMVTFFDERKVYGEFYLEDMINGFKYTDSDYITKHAYYHGDELVKGTEHDYVNSIDDKYRTVFWGDSFTVEELVSMTEPVKKENGYSIDHFEFNNKHVNENKEAKDFKLSVIIPTYNNGNHLLNKCFNSLKRSSIFKDMELVIVDDGSTDNYTTTVINHLARKYENVKTYFYHDNGSGSASRPRNKGLEISQAPFITYLDPDNEAINDGYNILLQEISNSNHDFVVGNMLKVSDDVQVFDYYKTMVQFNGKEVIKQKDIKQYLKNTSFKAMSIQALVMKRELAESHSLKMIEGAVGQDTLFFHELLMHAKQVKAINLNIHVYYAAVSGSVTNEISKSFFDSYFILEKKRKKFLEEQDLLEAYMHKKFYVYFKNWYLKKLNKVHREQLSDAVHSLYLIFELYKDHIQVSDPSIERFEELYSLNEYMKIANEFK
ncbi:hypothetical protein M948_05995 [Virgibacillus sp. CM-4]|uniref:glycosyltransferase n=1 Tax=Virgibacillus sp. CM-4 TaxID=1354277 RepID=UPI0003886BEF|nr:glycosyltransferase [Virgibacillus sp. CM-4]EQB38124.1 hypothetical protein M948_05995 [Virgibacillus sp. CM-4]